MTPEALELAVKAECGKIQSDTELDSNDISREGVFILKRIDERITDKRLRSFAGKADVREYSPHADTVRVIKVYPSDTQFDDQMVLGTHCAQSFDASAGVDERYLWPSLYAIDLQRRVRGLAPLKWGWNHIRRKITIDPMPTQDGDNYWYMSVERVNWTLANLPSDLEELLVTGAVWKCLEIVLGRRSNLGGIHREGGFVDYPAASLREWVNAKKDEFRNMLELKAAIYGSK